MAKTLQIPDVLRLVVQTFFCTYLVLLVDLPNLRKLRRILFRVQKAGASIPVQKQRHLRGSILNIHILPTYNAMGVAAVFVGEWGGPKQTSV